MLGPMANTLLDMHRLQEFVRLHRKGLGARQVAKLLKLGPNTERAYRRALADKGLLEGDAEQLPSLEALQEAVAKPKPAPLGSSIEERYLERIERLWKKGARPAAIYTRLKLEEPEFVGSPSSVKRFCARLKREQGPRAEEVAIVVPPVQGEAQVDFGDVVKFFDAQTGKERRTYAFVLTMSGSGRLFTRLVHDQRIETWIALHVEAFTELGCVPTSIVPDNLKSAVIKAAFGCTDTPELNRSYRELARHFGFVIDPTPAYSPNKKGRMENGVGYVKRSWLRTQEDVDFARAQESLAQWTKLANERVLERLDIRACEAFEDERKAMLPLPTAAYVAVVWAKAKVHRDSHICFRRHLYSVPWRLIGKQVDVRATAKTVEVYFESTRVATHTRTRGRYCSTNEHHLPDKRAALRHRSREYWERSAAELHPLALELVRHVFDSDHELSQLRQVQAMVTLLQAHPLARVESSCRRALFFGVTKYTALRDMLRNADDLKPCPAVVVPASSAQVMFRFARNTAEILNQPLEHESEPH